MLPGNQCNVKKTLLHTDVQTGMPEHSTVRVKKVEWYVFKN